MYRDVSDLETSYGADLSGITCWYYIDDQTLGVYVDDGTLSGTGYTDIWKLVSDKYRNTYYRGSDPSQPVSEHAACQSVADIRTIPSRYDFLHPFLETMAIMSAVLIFGLAFRLIIYPFFRRKL